MTKPMTLDYIKDAAGKIASEASGAGDERGKHVALYAQHLAEVCIDFEKRTKKLETAPPPKAVFG